VKYRKYRLRLSGEDQQAIALLSTRLPDAHDSLGEVREITRAIQKLFPGVKTEIMSVQRPQPAQAMRVRTL